MQRTAPDRKDSSRTQCRANTAPGVDQFARKPQSPRADKRPRNLADAVKISMPQYFPEWSPSLRSGLCDGNSHLGPRCGRLPVHACARNLDAAEPAAVSARNFRLQRRGVLSWVNVDAS